MFGTKRLPSHKNNQWVLTSYPREASLDFLQLFGIPVRQRFVRILDRPAMQTQKIPMFKYHVIVVEARIKLDNVCLYVPWVSVSHIWMQPVQGWKLHFCTPLLSLYAYIRVAYAYRRGHVFVLSIWCCSRPFDMVQSTKHRQFTRRLDTNAVHGQVSNIAKVYRYFGDHLFKKMPYYIIRYTCYLNTRGEIVWGLGEQDTRFIIGLQSEKTPVCHPLLDAVATQYCRIRDKTGIEILRKVSKHFP